MEHPDNMESRLWEYVDGMGSDSERSLIESLIQTQEVWKVKYAEIFEMHAMLSQTPTDAPSMRFTMNVMEEIGRVQISKATSQYINKNIIRGLAAFFILVILCIVVYSFGMVNWTESSTKSVSIPIKLEPVNYGAIFSNNVINVFLFVNVILGLFLLDRYFSMKRSREFD